MSATVSNCSFFFFFFFLIQKIHIYIIYMYSFSKSNIVIYTNNTNDCYQPA